MIKDISKTFLSIILFLYFSVIVAIVMGTVFHFELSNSNLTSLIVLDFSTSLSVVVILIILYFGLLKEHLKKVQLSGLKKFFLSALIAFLIMNVFKIFGGYISAFLSSIAGIEEATTENQSIIEKLLASAPIFMVISACVFAPISEEVIFRGAISKAIKNKKVFIAVSGLIFGLMHVTDSLILLLEILGLGVIISFLLENNKITKQDKIKLSVIATVGICILCGSLYYLEYGNLLIKITTLDLEEVIGSIVYITMGLYLAILYTENENIYLNIAVHALNNITSMIMLLFLL